MQQISAVETGPSPLVDALVNLVQTLKAMVLGTTDLTSPKANGAAHTNGKANGNGMNGTRNARRTAAAGRRETAAGTAPLGANDFPGVQRTAGSIEAAPLPAAPATEQKTAAELGQQPAIDPKDSIKPDYLICLEDGKPFKTLKRHLRVHFDMSPEQYKKKWGLPDDYPMACPNLSAAKRATAHANGLGRGGVKAAPSKKPGRPKKVGGNHASA